MRCATTYASRLDRPLTAGGKQGPQAAVFPARVRPPPAGRVNGRYVGRVGRVPSSDRVPSEAGLVRGVDHEQPLVSAGFNGEFGGPECCCECEPEGAAQAGQARVLAGTVTARSAPSGGKRPEIFGHPADHDTAGVLDHMDAFRSHGALVEAGLMEHVAYRCQEFVLIVHGRTVEAGPVQSVSLSPAGLLPIPASRRPDCLQAESTHTSGDQAGSFLAELCVGLRSSDLPYAWATIVSMSNWSGPAACWSGRSLGMGLTFASVDRWLLTTRFLS